MGKKCDFSGAGDSEFGYKDGGQPCKNTDIRGALSSLPLVRGAWTLISGEEKSWLESSERKEMGTSQRGPVRIRFWKRIWRAFGFRSAVGRETSEED